MATEALEERIATLEQEMAQMKLLLSEKKTAILDELPWWEKISGSFADDLSFDEAERLGREWRQSAQDSFDDDFSEDYK